MNSENILPVGTTLKNGQYRIVRHLKSGGFGNTYVVEDTSFHEQSAMKEFFIHAKGVNTRSGKSVTVSNPVNEDDFLLYKRKFIHEIQRLRELHNRHVVRIYDDFEENNTAYYVMEFIDGESLSDLLSRTGRAMTEAEVTDVLRQVLNALTEVHGKGFVHADITPNNIMIDKSGNVVLIDFGSTKEVEEGNHRSTLAAMTRTPGYTPQEQLDGDVSRMGPWSDFYALGVTLFRLLTLESPLELKDKEEEAFAPYQDRISQPMRDLILWMTKPNRRKRPQSVAEILAFVKENFTEQSTVRKQEEKPQTEIEGKNTKTKDEKTELEKKTDAKDKTEFEEKKAKKDILVAEEDVEELIDNEEDEAKKRKIKIGIGATCLILFGVLLWWGLTGNDDKSTNKVETIEKEVDLGLPSGTIWAGWNIGANSPSEKGSLFAWGELKTKKAYSWDNYFDENGKRFNIDSLASGKHSLIATECDVATQSWGSDWCMPSKEQVEELINNCAWKWGTSGGCQGLIGQGPNGKTIFFPVTGYRNEAENILWSPNSDGSYWVGELCHPKQHDHSNYHEMVVAQSQNSQRAYCFSFDNYDKTIKFGCSERYYGHAVRAVKTSIIDEAVAD